MFVIKNKYFLIIENTKDINLKNIKIRNKFFIIYRNDKKIDDLSDLFRFRQVCKSKAIKFFVANDIKLAIILNSDGIYLSSYNKELKFLNYKKSNFEIIGSAHNLKEVSDKIKQGCSLILLSKLFLVDYKKKSPYLGVIKFNNFLKISKNIIPLGGIKEHNLNNLNNVLCEGFAILSEVKKKPANIINRLF
jgi:thiamine-phosphate pyrophosphorylase